MTVICRQEVCEFAVLMEKQLQANEWKGGWQDSNSVALIVHLLEEVKELLQAVNGAAPVAHVYKEAADVGNLAMMVADVYSSLLKVRPSHEQ